MEVGNLLQAMHPVLQSLAAGCFTWGVTALGAASVFLTREVGRKTLDAMLGFAGGVMIAASFWSLLAPAIEMAAAGPGPAWLPAAVGFLAGGAFLWVIDRVLPHLHLGFPLAEAEGPRSGWDRAILLVTAVTVHNIPEGLAMGVAFGGVAAGLSSSTLAGALALALGIGIQNFPEGLAVSVPLYGEGVPRVRAFGYGQLSGMVEPLAAMLGATAVLLVTPLLPYALAFAAGAMVFVVVEEVVPESQRNGNADLATLAAMLGFVVMMVLDVAFG
ncbi:MAG: ZIP family metal transporter [Syntrophomonadaceae bacterium]|jgi:ZIP family zinc transporter|nr:ZIP family metal transporter [Syntrophomonadaceae bacterium]MDH7497067.1 ZIP family metal transporter [Syntrophomonadaceae bacterium]